MRKRKNDAGEHNEFLAMMTRMMDLFDNAACEISLDVRNAMRRIEGYQETRQVYNKSIESLEQQITEHEDELQKHVEFIKKKEQELAIAKIELESVKKKVNTIEQSLSEAKRFHNNLEIEKTDIQILREKQKKFVGRMSKVVVIHKSSEKIKKQINKYQLGIIVVNSCDNNGYINTVKPDRIVKPEELTKFFIQVPYDFEEKYNEKEKESIRAYCNLVANVVSCIDDDSRIKLLYCNEDIAKILKLNGIEA